MERQDGMENSIVEIRTFLAKNAQPFTMAEFAEFWKSCSEEEKAEFKKTDLNA